MSISGVGYTNSYIYKKENRCNNQSKETVLYNNTGIPTDLISRRELDQNRGFSANDAYNSMVMNRRFRSEIGEYYLLNVNDGNANLLNQINGEVQKLKVIDI